MRIILALLKEFNYVSKIHPYNNNAALFQCVLSPVCYEVRGCTCTPLPVIALHHKEVANGRMGLLHGAKHSTATGCFLLTGPPIAVFYLLYYSINSCNDRHITIDYH